MAKESCKAKNVKGEPCGAAAGPSGLCHLHANPERAKQLGQLGGRKNRHFTGVDIEVPSNMNANDLCELASRTIGLVLQGELQAREAGAVADLINAQSRLIPLIAWEKRLASLERQAAHVLERPEPISQRQGGEVSAKQDAEEYTPAIATDTLSATNGSETLETSDGRGDDVNAEKFDASETTAEA